MKKMVLAVCCCAALLGGCGDRYEAKSGLTPYKEELFAMDTYMNLCAYGEQSQKAVEAASAEIQRLDELLSVTGESGDVYQLNQLGQRQVEADTLAVISRAVDVTKETDGLFDCTITPVMKLWGFRDGNFRVPSPEELAEQLAKVDGSKVRIEGNTVTLLDGVTVDLGAIAKGYTSQRIMEVYRENDVTSGIVSLGGNVQTLGRKPDGSLWRVALEDPRNPEDYFGILDVENKAVITSGGYQRYFDQDGKRYHHIIDPATGYPSDSGLLSVTIISENGTKADALSTALFVMGYERAVELWRQSDDFEVIFVTEDGKVIATEGIADQFTFEGKDNDFTYETVTR